jgi:hypothetical protein
LELAFIMQTPTSKELLPPVCLVCLYVCPWSRITSQAECGNALSCRMASIAAASTLLHRTTCNTMEECRDSRSDGGGRLRERGTRQQLMRGKGERRGRRELMSAFCIHAETVGAHLVGPGSYVVGSTCPPWYNGEPYKAPMGLWDPQSGIEDESCHNVST